MLQLLPLNLTDGMVQSRFMSNDCFQRVLSWLLLKISAMRINQRNLGDSSARQHQLSRMQSELTVTVDSGQDNRENNKGPTS